LSYTTKQYHECGWKPRPLVVLSFLFLIRSNHLAGLWVHQMYPRASGASNGLVELSLALAWIITDLSVHIVPRVGATIDNWSAHKRAIKAVPLSTALT